MTIRLNHMNVGRAWQLGLGTLIASALLGCASEVGPVSELQDGERLINGTVYEDVSVEYGVSIDDANARGVAAVDQPSAEGKYPKPRLPIVDLGKDGAPPPMESFSREKLAYGLRAVVNIEGKHYREKNPRWDLADRALAAPEVFEAYPGPETQIESELGELERDAAAFFSGIFDDPGEAGTIDNRGLQPNALPHNRIVTIGRWELVQGTERITSVWCSGTIIGWRTILTAAHCVTNGEGAILSSIAVTAWQNGWYTTNPSGWSPHGWKKTPAAGIFVPAEYIDLDNDIIHNDEPDYDWDFMPWDFAVIVIPQAWYAFSPGYTGYSANRTPTSATVMEAHGFPAASTCLNGTTPPRLCGMSGIDTYVNGPYFETWSIDLSGGQSGGPWWFATDRRPMGISIAGSGYHDFGRCGFDICWRNFARRIDNTVNAFIQTHSNDY